MPGIHERQAERLRALHNVIRAVADDERIRPFGERTVHHLAARAAAHCDTLHRLARVGKTHAARMQLAFDISRECARLHGFGQVAHAAQHPVLPGFHIHDIGQTEHSRKRIVHAALGAVGVGMHTDHRNAVPDRVHQRTAGGVVRRDRMHGGENHRMVRHDKLCAAVDGLLHHTLGHIERT